MAFLYGITEVFCLSLGCCRAGWGNCLRLRHLAFDPSYLEVLQGCGFPILEETEYMSAVDRMIKKATSQEAAKIFLTVFCQRQMVVLAKQQPELAWKEVLGGRREKQAEWGTRIEAESLLTPVFHPVSGSCPGSAAFPAARSCLSLRLPQRPGVAPIQLSPTSPFFSLFCLNFI